MQECWGDIIVKAFSPQVAKQSILFIALMKFAPSKEIKTKKKAWKQNAHNCNKYDQKHHLKNQFFRFYSIYAYTNF